MPNQRFPLFAILCLILLNMAPGFAVAEDGPAPVPQDVTFISSLDGSTQHYVLLEPRARKSRDVLIALHGHGSDRWQFVHSERDEARAAREVAAERGMLFVSPDYRAPASWMGPAAEADLRQIIAELKQRHRAARVFLCGGSMGGTAALIFTARHPELIDGVASMNGTANMLMYDQFQEAIQASYGGTKTDVPEEYLTRSPELFPGRFTMPVGITAGGQDTVAPPDSVLRLARMIEILGGRTLVVYREAGGHATTYEDARAIIEFVLAGAKPREQPR